MALKLTNNAAGRLAANLSDTDTTVILQTGEGGEFPALNAGDWFPITVLRPDDSREIMRVIARDGDALTVIRAQENTPAMSFTIDDRVELRTTAGIFDDKMPKEGGAIGPLTVTGSLSVSGSITQGGQQVWHAGNFTPTSKLDVTGGTVTGGLAVTGSITQNGQQVWHAGNFNPGTKADLAGASFTGKLSSANLGGAMGANDSCSIEIRNNGGTGDNNMAMLGFFSTSSYGIKLGLRADGYFGLGGWSRSAWSWYSDAAGNMVSAGNVSAYSDPRLKTDVEPIAGALEIIERLDGVRFTWNGRSELVGRPGMRDIGVLADQVEAVLPEIVGRSIPDEKNDGERWRIVAYDKLVPVLIEAVKELSVRVRVLEVLK